MEALRGLVYAPVSLAIQSEVNEEFDKLINIINEAVDTKDVLSFCKELRLTANVEGKMYDYTTQYRVLDVPIKIINPYINDNTYKKISKKSKK